MTAEEMAPYLEPPEPSLPSSAAVAASLAPPYPYPDESFVLPALIKFGGEAVVDDATGGLLYRFPSLQRTGVKHKVRGMLLGGGGGSCLVDQSDRAWDSWSRRGARQRIEAFPGNRW